jgi:hypothetical protein
MRILVAGQLYAGVFIAQPDDPQRISTPSSALVYSAFAHRSSWSKATALLQAKGLRIVAVQNPLSSLAADVPPKGYPKHRRCDVAAHRGQAEQKSLTTATELSAALLDAVQGKFEHVEIAQLPRDSNVCILVVQGPREH